MTRCVLTGTIALPLVLLGACERAAPPPPKTTPAPAAATQAAPWYKDLSLPAASDTADAEHKVLLIALYTSDGGLFHRMERTVLEDPRVRRLLNRYTVPLKVNAANNALLAARYGFNGVPLLLFLQPDGSEIERIEGSVFSVESFLESATHYVAGRDRIARALEEAIDAHLRLAEALTRKRKLREALEEYAWAWERCTGSRDAFARRGGDVLPGLRELAGAYRPAREALEGYYEAARQRLLGDKPQTVDLMIIAALGFLRVQPDETLALYDQIRGRCPDAETLAVWNGTVVPMLLEARRYEDIAARIDLAQEIEKLFEDAQDEPQREDYENDREFRHVLHAHWERLREPAIAYYQVLIGLERYEAADDLAARLLEQAGGCRVYHALALAGYCTGHPTEANLAQARKAYECSHGDSAAITDTLARVLAALGQRAEALQLLADSLQRTNNENDRSVLEQCRTEIEAQP